MAPIPTPTQNVDASTTASASASAATLPPVHQPPGQPIILIFVLLIFTLGCSTYFLCRNVRFKKIIISLSAPGKRVSVNALRAPTKLVAVAPSKTLYSYATDKGDTSVMFDSTSNVKASTSASSASSASASALSDSGLHCVKIRSADSQSNQSTTPIEMHSSAAQTSPGDIRLSAPLQIISTTIKSSFDVIFSRPLPNIYVTQDALEACGPRRLVSTSINIPEFEFVPHLASAIEFASRTKSKTSRRHTINIYASAKESGSVQPINRHARSATAPLTIVLTSNKLAMPMKNGSGNENIIVE